MVDKATLTSTATVFISKLLLRHQPTHWRFTYVKTMSFLVVPFIMILPELDAFFTFTTFIRHCCPLYAQHNLLGAHCGVKVCSRIHNFEQIHCFLITLCVVQAPGCLLKDSGSRIIRIPSWQRVNS
jgi:hypothetical protein